MTEKMSGFNKATNKLQKESEKVAYKNATTKVAVNLVEAFEHRGVNFGKDL